LLFRTGIIESEVIGHISGLLRPRAHLDVNPGNFSSTRLPMLKLSLIFFVIFSVQALAQPASTKQGTVFRDGPNFPDMVLIPSGKFDLGQTPTYLPDQRQPQGTLPATPDPHQIAFSAPFAISKYPITVKQWEACVSAGGCTGFHPQYLEPPWVVGRNPNDPVTDVSWNDAQTYVTWLNSVMNAAGKGTPYSLPSEAEWEYVAIAGTPWNDPGVYAQWLDQLGKLPSIYPRLVYPPHDMDWHYVPLIGITPSHWRDVALTDGFLWWWGYFDRPIGSNMQVGQKPSNPFGVYDMLAPYGEWVADCWEDTLDKAPSDGSAYTLPGCTDMTVKGEFNDSSMPSLPSDRSWRYVTLRLHNIGFRVVRSMP
jgi:formylglycine-generating enzyme required for sulfatase activity